MAKKVNIITTLQRELTKGNFYLDRNGSVVVNEIKDESLSKAYGKAIVAGEIAADITFGEFKESYMKQFIPIMDVLNSLIEGLAFVVDWSADDATENPIEDTPE